MGKFFKALKEGLEEAIEYEKAEKKQKSARVLKSAHAARKSAESKKSGHLRSRFIVIPPPPKSYEAKDIKKIRKKLECSQAAFAKILNISVKTVQAWEAGTRSPNHAALRLLEIIDKGMYFLHKDIYSKKPPSKSQRIAA